MEFAAQLREAMGDMSQAALADRTGIRQSTISRYLRGDRLPQLQQLDALEQVLPRLHELRAQANTARSRAGASEAVA
jgi:transcriptional regulator with XRE-family HTH domain